MAAKKKTKQEKARETIQQNHQETKALAQRAIAWLKQQALVRASQGDYHRKRGFNTGEVVRGLGLGSAWDTRAKVYTQLMQGMKRAEELGFVTVCRNSSPLQFRYAGPEVEEAEAKYKKDAKDARDRMERLVRKVRIKGIAVSFDRYEGREGLKVTMSASAFERLAGRAEVVL